MVNVKKAKTAFSLLRKELGIEISRLSKEGLKDVKIPESAVSYDAVKVGEKANPTTNFTDVFIFRDKDGNVVSTVHNKIDNDKIRQSVRKYSEQTEDTLYIDRGEYDDVVQIKRQTVRGYDKEDGKYTKCIEEQRAVSVDKKMMETLKREVYPGSEEVIRVSRFENGAKPKYIENHYEKIPIGYEFSFAPEFVKEGLMKKALKEPSKYAGSYRLTNSEVSSEELKELAKHPYFLPFFSPDNKFIYRMAREVEKEKMSLTKRVKVFPYSKKTKTVGNYVPMGLNDLVFINRINKDGSKRTRGTIANTVGHEFGHADWAHKVDNYELFGENYYKDQEKAQQQIEKIKKYKKAGKNYVRSEENEQAYKDNYMEVLARQEGRATEQKYDNLGIMTDEHFPAVRGVYRDLKAESDACEYALREFMYDFSNHKDIV